MAPTDTTLTDTTPTDTTPTEHRGPAHDAAHVRDGLADELPHLRRYAMALARDAQEADDLVQDTVLRAIERAHQFRPGTHLRRWLFTILRNGSIDRVRKVQRRGPEIPVSPTGETEPGMPVLSRPAAQEDHLELGDVVRGIGDLEPSQRQVLALSVVDGLGHAEIARRMDIAEGTVKSRLSRARARLAA